MSCESNVDDSKKKKKKKKEKKKRKLKDEGDPTCAKVIIVFGDIAINICGA